MPWSRLCLTRASNRAAPMRVWFDWRFPPERSHEIVFALLHNGLDVCYVEVDSAAGHDSFLLDHPYYHGAVRAYMERVAT